jgi:hypothetical protein
LFYLACTGKDVGDRASLAEIQQAKDNDPSFQNLTKEERKEALDELVLHREEKTTNARVTNKGAARDVFLVMNMVEKEV